jgi:hypothetical protein
MAINPFPRIQGLDIPTALPSGARAPEGTFNNIASIGDAIGNYRERNAMGELLKGAVDPQTGVLDTNKAATLIALSGRDPVKYLTLVEAARGRSTQENAQRALEAYHERTATEAARANREAERQRQQQIDQPTTTVVPPSLLSPGGAYTVPRDLTQPPVIRPFPLQGTPGQPQSALEAPGPNIAAAEPNLEEAPPYRVAGPPMPSPTAPATAEPTALATQPAATPARNEGFLRTLPPAGQELIKGLADYKLDPSKASREELAAVRTYRPDWDQTEYQKGANPPSSETQARLSLAKSFLARAPGIKSRVERGELTDVGGKALAFVGQGGAGELRRGIEEGAEGLERLLTGAAMPASEAANYARRYTFDIKDTRETAIRKLNELENANRWMVTEVGHGRRTGENLLNGFRDKFGEEVVPKAAVPRAQNDVEVNKQVGMAQKQYDKVTDPAHKAEVIRRLQERLPEGMDARRLLNR